MDIILIYYYTMLQILRKAAFIVKMQRIHSIEANPILFAGKLNHYYATVWFNYAFIGLISAVICCGSITNKME